MNDGHGNFTGGEVSKNMTSNLKTTQGKCRDDNLPRRVPDPVFCTE